MWNGKMKALTFSFDDGVLQDERAIKILDKYNLKATFNLNSSLLGLKNTLPYPDKPVCHDKIDPNKVCDVYKNHEVAVHTLTHPNLTQCSDAVITHQVEEDRLLLEKLTGKQVVGMAYPCGGVNNDDRVASIIKKTTKVKYCRTITSTYSFDLQENLYRFNPTVYYIEKEKLFTLGKKFISLKPDKPSLFYIWGHTYEMDRGGEFVDWDEFDEFCKLISNKDDVFYGTNTEVLL